MFEAEAVYFAIYLIADNPINTPAIFIFYHLKIAIYFVAKIFTHLAQSFICALIMALNAKNAWLSGANLVALLSSLASAALAASMVEN